ncbi:NAD(P)H-hydrate dehydratase [Candidatus Marsarchaeota archaeon]|nr:NAD(P)H-hydrate dehydratase [Candidatus Marsarchaeota archaeon]
MQKLKEFVIYTKKYLGIGDSYAILANAKALGMNERLIADDSGAAIAESLKRKQRNDKITFVCGPGGKGAIGMATARHIMDFADVEVAFIGEKESIRNECNMFNYKILENIMDITHINSDNMNILKSMLKKSDDVVDAIVGLGMKGRLSGTIANAIKTINESGKYVISIDVPSGVNADNGSKNVSAVNPDIVISINKMKNYLSLPNSKYNASVVNIGVPPSVEIIAGPGDVMLATRPRSIYASKYDHGNVLVLGGSIDYRGAPMLTGMAAEHALAALKTGSGYVTVMSPEDSLVNEQRPMPELIMKMLSKERLAAEDIKKIAETKHDAIVIGPGLPNDYLDYEQFSKLLALEREKGRPIIADAAALRAFAKSKNLIGSGMVLTPHTGEFKYLSGTDLSKRSINARIYASIDFAKTYGCTLVLKGNETIITDGKRLKINKAETPALATMGTGDVLAGIIASYAAINKGEIFESSVAGVHVHSTIGDKLYKEMGLHATAYDVAMAIPSVVKEFDKISY